MNRPPAPAPVLGALFVFATCGIAVEMLLIGLSGYLLGETLLLICVVLGVFLSSMGVGAHLSRRVADPVGDAYVGVGIWLGVVGGATPALLVLASAYGAYVELLLGVCACASGALLGAALPLCARLLGGWSGLSRLVAVVMALDYLGALAGSLLLPLVVLPHFGYIGGAAVLGLLCVGASVVLWWSLRRSLSRSPFHVATIVVGVVLLGTVAGGGERLFTWAFTKATGERVLHREHTPYQEILISQHPTEGLVLRLNGQPQFSQKGERAYHEALVHPAFGLVSPPVRRVLVLGGGDGLALREILKYREVRQVVLVDLDPRMVLLSRTHPKVRAWNEDSFSDPRVRVVHDDAFLYVQRRHEKFDLAFIDLPSPANISLSKLYTVQFYRSVANQVRARGLIAVQSTGFNWRRARVFRCITRTLKEAGLYVHPYLVGNMGFNLVARHRFDPTRLVLRAPTRVITPEYIRSRFALPGDIRALVAEPNRIESHVILHYAW